VGSLCDFGYVNQHVFIFLAFVKRRGVGMVDWGWGWIEGGDRP